MILDIRQGHATERMTERKISRQDIENAIRNHRQVVNDPSKPSVTYIGPGVNGRTLKVFTLPPGYVNEQTPVIIKSAAWKGTP
ncbi:DUF4258 domain-containing protein [Nocardioides bruguierae]|uniref:DUF4258 domain-containing protein n=1 Tax=Nocardioides bruguierae TaxID=2945102 RepID=UPI003556905F